MSNLSLLTHTPARALALLAGLLMLAVALPYGVAMSKLTGGGVGLTVAIQQHESALAIFPDTATAASLATLRLADARTGKGTWQQAQVTLEATLAARPQDPLGWARLAYVYGEQQNYERLGEALQRSIETGRYIPGFMQWRFLLGLTYWQQLDTGQKQLIAGQALILWQTKPNDFIRLARMPAIAPQIESIMQEYSPSEASAFLQRRRPLRHNQ